MKNIKSGEYCYIQNIRYLFLGYINYKRTLCYLADMYGNTCKVWIDYINKK